MDEDLNKTDQYSSEPTSTMSFLLLALILGGAVVFYFSSRAAPAAPTVATQSQTIGSANR
jgi:hypothetical protein